MTAYVWAAYGISLASLALAVVIVVAGWQRVKDSETKL
jgi:heme exporter protein D